MPTPAHTLCDQSLTYSRFCLGLTQLQHRHLQALPPPFPLEAGNALPPVPLRRSRLNMTMVVDIEGILPEDIRDRRTGQPILNLDSMYI